MLEWLVQTCEYFATRPDLQLLIRVHPAEISGFPPSRVPARRRAGGKCRSAGYEIGTADLSLLPARPIGHMLHRCRWIKPGGESRNDPAVETARIDARGAAYQHVGRGALESIMANAIEHVSSRGIVHDRST